jgi:hypothetical protein
MDVNIWDKDGIKVDSITINDDLLPVNGRVSKGKNSYYKGVGVVYTGHNLFPLSPQTNLYGYSILQPSTVFYMGPRASKSCFEGKVGIFQEPYQPQFNDWIGSCGVKELSLIENSEDFELSSVEFLNVVNYDRNNQQYYFEVDYKCGRRKYLDDGDPLKLRELLDYMIRDNWNFIWDKTSITDISFDGRVSDTADLFQSKITLSHKLGTVYSVLYSLGKLDHSKYLEFLKVNNMSHENDMDYVYNSIDILKQNGVDVTELFVFGDKYENYKNVILNHLVVGKNCGDCCYIEVGEKIRDAYIRRAKAQFSIDEGE